MLEEVHVAEVLEKAKRAIEKKDVIAIKNLSDQTIHSASIHQDPDNISVAVILYSLSKMIERERYQEYPGWQEFERNYIDSLDKASIALRRKDLDVYREQIENIRQSIDKLSGKLKFYMGDVFRKAKINKASRLYEHGISLEKTAKILGITIWELNQYVGRTGIADVNLAYTKDLNSRIKLAEGIFKK